MRGIAELLRERRDEASELVAAETGKPLALARGETAAAIEMGFFVAGEGRRFYGRTTTASMPHRTVMTLRRPVGVAALLISFNTPLPNVAWKAFPAILCGNASVLKPSEHAPLSGWWLGRLCLEAGLPPGVLNVVHGLGPGGRAAARRGPARRPRQLHGLGGDRTGGSRRRPAAGSRRRASSWAARTRSSSATTRTSTGRSSGRSPRRSPTRGSGALPRAGSSSSTGSTTSSATRLLAGVDALEPPGPVISEASMERILGAVARAREEGAVVVRGGERVGTAGWHVAPTLVEGLAPDAALACEELFGPVAALFRVGDLDEAVALVNDSPYGLTSAIHTASVHRAMRFAERVAAGVIVVNAGTHGSEPHMGFGGVRQSGTGWKEAGVEALDVYSEVQYVNLVVDPALA